MTIDHAPAFLANSGNFIINNPIALNGIQDDMGPGGIPALNNMRCMFTLSQATQQGLPAPNSLPMLRMRPGMGGGGLTTILGWYCRAGDGGMHVDLIPFVDLPLMPGPADPRFVFTVGMNGCTLILATAVPATAPPLAANHVRLLHDHSHYALAHWAAAGYMVRFASYAGPGEAGPVPVAFAALNLTTYNPHNYPWGYAVPAANMAPVRVVTNFLHHDGVAWNFHSRHYHTAGAAMLAVDAPPGTVPPLASTQSMAI